MKSTQNHYDAQLGDILNIMPIAVCSSDISSGHIEYINEAFIDLFGYSFDDLVGVDTCFFQAFCDPDYYRDTIQPWFINNKGKTSTQDLKIRMQCKDGSFRQVSVCCSTTGDRQLWYFNDMTDSWIAEERLRARSEMLEMVAKGLALKDILKVIVEEIQLENPQSVCSVLLYDKKEDCLRLGAAPSLPDFYNEAIDGVKIGPDVGCCGTAAYYQHRVIVENIDHDEKWEEFTELACKAGLAACWSDPIVSSKGELLGTFAIYRRMMSAPSDKDFELINFASSLASIAIESSLAQEELEHRAYYDHLTGLFNRGYFFEKCEQAMQNIESGLLSIVMLDLDDFKTINDDYGHKTGDLVLQKFAEVSRIILSEDDVIARIGGEEFAIFLASTGKEEALSVAENLRQTIEKSVVLDSNKQEVSFTVSLGVTYIKEGVCSIDELLSKADKALYQSKSAGKNCISVLECVGCVH